MREVKILAALLASVMLIEPAYGQCSQQSLRIAVIPKKSMEVLLREQRPLIEHLRRATGIPVEIVPSSSYESVVDAIVSGGVDLAWLGPASYILAYQRDPRIEPFASLTIAKGFFTPAGQHYQALLVARQDVARQTEGLRGKRVALTDPASTSGSIIPNAEFSARIGMPLPQFFSSVVYSGSHDKSLDAVLDRKVEAAFVSSVRVDEYLNRGVISRETLSVLWRSEPIYYDPFVFRGALCADIKARIRDAMLVNNQGLSGFLDSQEASGIVPVGHAQYAPLLQKMQQIAPAQ